VVKGAPQGNNQDVYVSPAQLAQTTYQSGPGTDTIWVRANDGIIWGPWSQSFMVSAPIPKPAVLTVTSDSDAVRGTSLALSQLVTISDLDQAGFQMLELWDSNGTPGGGQFVINGMSQTGGHEIDVAPGDVPNTLFSVGSAGGTDTLWARLLQSNGQLTAWQSFTVTAPSATLPSLASHDIAAARGDSFSLSALVTISDPDQAGFQMLHLWDSNGTVGGGQFMVNGVAQTGGHEIDVAPADVTNTVFNVGTLGGSDTLYAQLLQWNGQLTAWKSFTVTAPVARLPSLSVFDDPSAVRGAPVALGNLVSIADPDRVSFQKLELWDSSGGSALAGQFVVNGAPQGGGREIDVTPADVANTFFNVGSLGGSDLLWAQLVESDGQLSGWKSFTVSAPPARLPSFSVSSPLAARGDTIALSDLVKISDPDSIGFQALHLWDSNGTVGGGRFVVNGMPQTGGHVIDVSPSDFASTVFKVGTLGGTDQLWVQLLQVNGELSSWTPFTVTAPAAQLPSVAVQDDRSATAGESIPLSRLVTVVDPQNVGFQSLQLWDSNGTSAGGQFVIGNSPQTGGHIIEVAPADLANTVFHVGTLGATDQLWAQIVQSNGQASGWKPFNIEVADNGVTTLDATFTSSGGVKSVAFKLDYDPELVTVADAELGADLPDTARVAFRSVATEDGAEAYITVTSEEPIAAGRVNIASVSITPRHSGRHLDGIRKLHVHDVNGGLFAKPEKVRIRIDDVAQTSSEMSGTEQDVDFLERSSAADSSAHKIRVKIPSTEASTENASSGSILTDDPAQDWGDLRTPVRIAIGELPATDTDLLYKDLRHSRRWNLDWSTNGSATNLPEKVRIPFASLAKGADPSPNP
jgi:uncharacterized protein (DUF983 family)